MKDKGGNKILHISGLLNDFLTSKNAQTSDQIHPMNIGAEQN
jgi:hypothetical protein